MKSLPINITSLLSYIGGELNELNERYEDAQLKYALWHLLEPSESTQKNIANIDQNLIEELQTIFQLPNNPAALDSFKIVSKADLEAAKQNAIFSSTTKHSI